MGKNRDTIDIVADVLKVASVGSKKTNIMYKANLSYSQLCRYLELTINTGLVQNGSSFYEVTEKGEVFLKFYDYYCRRRKEIEEDTAVLNFDRKKVEQMIKNP